MNSDTKHIYLFDEFKFDAERFALYFRGDLIKAADKKPLEVLAALLLSPNELVSYDEIIKFVWADNEFGVTPPRVNQYVSKLHKIFVDLAPGSDYFQNSKGRGYMFTGDVEMRAAESNPENESIAQPLVEHSILETAESAANHPSPHRRFVTIYIAAVILGIAAVAAWMLYLKNEEEAIKRVVNDSQMYESLILYKTPTTYSESELDKYWTPELRTNVNYDRVRIRDAAKKMVDEGRRYGGESKCEQFDFQALDINKDGETAIVKTLEKWFVAIYQNDGTLLKNRTIGPYFVSYILRKIDGRWLIEKSSTARVSRPMPRLDTVEPETEAAAGTRFLIKLTGLDFESETVYIDVVGPGCPEVRPCKIPNSVLREEAKLTDTVIDRVPLTLASGEFKIYVRNGESQPSESAILRVP